MDFKSRMLRILQFWRSFIVVLVPLVPLPLVFVDKNQDSNNAYRCAYVMVIMAIFWISEVLPLAVTSLIPIVLFPFLGIMTTDEVGREYLKETNLMFMSGVMVAIAVEHCQLHTRIALKVLLFVGTGPRRLMAGFMLTTMFFSMWISNTATTAMMVPIVTGVVNELESSNMKKLKQHDRQSNADGDSSGEEKDSQLEMNDQGEGNHPPQDFKAKEMEQQRQMRIMMYLSVAYAANVGGTGTLTGSGASLVLKGTLDSSFEETPINFATWMAYAVPQMILTIVFCWCWLQVWFMGIPKGIFRRKKSRDGDEQSRRKKALQVERNERIRSLLNTKYNELGPMTFQQVAVLLLLILLVFLWFFRDPGFLKGWGNYIYVEREEYQVLDEQCNGDDCPYQKVIVEKEAIDDATAGMLIVIVLFIIPAKLNFWPFNKKKLQVLDFLSKEVLLLIIIVFSAMATEVTSNVATISIILPIVRDLALSLLINPLYLMIPATVAVSYSFMLPIATPPNAIVYSGSQVMKTSDMVKCGFFVNVVCLGVNYLCINTYGILMFDLNEFPQWANSTTSS